MLVLQACRPCTANIHTKFKASGLEGNLFKTLRLKTAKPILTYRVSFLKLFQSTEPNLISGRRQKGG